MSDLDDFFAKKDKNKKGKKKTVSSDVIGKKFDKNIEKSREKKFPANLANLKGYIQDGDEWKDFEDEENKDYSGLKIQALSINDEEDEQREAEDEAAKKDQNETAWKCGDAKQENETEKKDSKKDDEDDSFIARFLNRGPRINDKVEFPTLGAPNETSADMKGFQTVRSSNVSNIRSNLQSTITTENKYNSLGSNKN